MKKIIYNILVLSFIVGFSSCKFENTSHLESPIIPRPNTMFPATSSFTISENTKILLESEDQEMILLGQKLKVMLDSITHFNISVLPFEEVNGMKDVIFGEITQVWT